MEGNNWLARRRIGGKSNLSSGGEMYVEIYPARSSVRASEKMVSDLGKGIILVIKRVQWGMNKHGYLTD